MNRRHGFTVNTYGEAIFLPGVFYVAALGLALPFCGTTFGQQGQEDSGARPFVIKVVDEQTGRGVPLVKLETVNHRLHYTDSMGVVAFDELGLMGKKVFFHVSSHGYEFPADGFKFRGKTLQVVAGGSATLKIKRLNIAERLYRITGEGIYAESVKSGLQAPIEQPLLNSGVLGSDSILSAVYHDRIFWAWGDTNQAGYPLGNFLVTAATSALPGKGGLDPDVGINLDYFADGKGFTKKMAPLPGQRPTWLDALTTLTDKNGEQQLVAHYVKIKPPMTTYESGLCVYNPGKEVFEGLHVFPKDEKLIPHGHPFAHRLDGKDYIYYGSPFPKIRIPATFEAWADPAQYEAVETDVAFMDPETKKPLKTHAGSMAWNPYLKKWIAIFTQAGGTSSMLGEIWFATAAAPEGPWRQAVKILTHDHYSFYNPRHHPFLDKEGGKVIYFEGTYTQSFSASPVVTPRYDYNQIMYRLDLADPRLKGGGE